MSVDEARRLALHDAAAHNRWNAEAALTLMEMLPPSGWSDVVRRSDLDARLEALEHRIDLRFQLVDQRFEALQDHLDARIERSLNRSIRWNVGTMIALAGVATAAARLG